MCIKTTTVEIAKKSTTTEFDEFEHAPEAAPDPTNNTEPTTTMTVEDAIQSRLAGFLGKRKASVDARPCGPHDLGSIYLSVFGISKGDLKDERFLARLRRSSLDESTSSTATIGKKKK